MNDLKPLVIVISRNYSTGLGVIRSLGAAGYSVDLIASVKKKGSSIIASCSKYVRNSTEVFTPNIQGDSGDNLINALMGYVNSYNGKIVIFPADDFTASVVAANYDLLKEHFLMPYVVKGTGYALTELMDKTVQSEMARKAGLLTPLEWTISLNDEIVIPEGVVYPCFVKPLQSVFGHKTEMAICSDKDDLMQHLCEMKAFYRNRRVLVQEYLQIDKEYDISGVCLDQEVIIPAIIEKKRIARYEYGVTMSGRMHNIDILDESKYQVINLLKNLHYVGMFDMELNVCGGKIYFNEINLRSGGPNFAYYLNGVNLPDIFIKNLLGERHCEEEKRLDCFGKTFVYEKVAWEDYMHSYMTRQELKDCIAHAEFTLLENKEDPAPGRCFKRRIRLSALKHKLKTACTLSFKRVLNSNKNLLDTKAPNISSAQNKKETVVIAGRNYSNLLTMTRALGIAGYDVDVLRVFKNKPRRMNLIGNMRPEAKSRYVRNYYECVAYGKTEPVIDKLLEIYAGENKRLLIPVDDYLVDIIDRNLDSLNARYMIHNINNTQGEICRLMDKSEQKKLAEGFGLPVLPSGLVKFENNTYEIPSNIQYPCFIKPNISVNSTKAKMAKCNTERELVSILNTYSKSESCEMLVEKFADIKTEYSVLGMSTGENIVSPCVFKTLRGGHRERKGVALTGEIVSADSLKNIISKCNRFIKSLGFVGLFDVDLIETKDGELYFVELNFRAGASVYAFNHMNVNLPGMFSDYFLKNIAPNADCKLKETGKRFISEKVLLEEYARSDINMSEVRHELSAADIFFMKDEKDPRPYENFRKFYSVAAAMRLPYRLRDRRRGIMNAKN